MGAANNKAFVSLFERARTILSRLYGAHKEEFQGKFEKLSLREGSLISNVHASLNKAFENSPAAKAVYAQIWENFLQAYFACIEGISALDLEEKIPDVDKKKANTKPKDNKDKKDANNELALKTTKILTKLNISLEKMKKGLPHQEHYAELSRSEKNLFEAIVQYYPALIKQCYLLWKISTLDTDVEEIEQNNTRVLVAARQNLNTANSLENKRLLHDIKRAVDNLYAEGNEIVAGNGAVALYTKNLSDDIADYRVKQNNDFKPVDDIFKAFKSKFDALNKRITRHEATSRADAEEGTKRATALLEKMNGVERELNAITAENVLANLQSLEAEDNFPAKFARLQGELTTLRKACADEESNLDAEVQAIQKNNKELEAELSQFKSKTGFITDIKKHRDDVSKQKSQDYVSRVPRVFSIPEILDAAKLNERVTKQIGELSAARSRLEASQKSYMEFRLKVRNSRLGWCVTLAEYRSKAFLADTNKEYDLASKALSSLLGKKDSGWLGKTNPESVWQIAANAVDASREKVVTDVQQMQDTLAGPSAQTRALLNDLDLENTTIGLTAQARAECDDFDAYLEKEQQGHAKLQAELEARSKDFEKQRDEFEQLKTDLNTHILNKMQLLHDTVIQKIDGIKQRQNARLDELQSETKNYKPKINPLPKTGTKLLSSQLQKQLDRKLEALNLLYQSKMLLLAKSRTEQNRKEHEIIDRVHKAEQPKKADSEPGFFARHWGKMAAAAVLGGTVGGALGFTAGMVGAAPTLGFSTLILTAVGIGLGGAIGFFAGLINAVCLERRVRRMRANVLPQSQVDSLFIQKQLQQPRPKNAKRLQRTPSAVVLGTPSPRADLPARCHSASDLWRGAVTNVTSPSAENRPSVRPGSSQSMSK